MKPDWDSLSAEYKDSTTVIIADVDCTTDGKSLCDKHGVKGYPTIKIFAAGDDEGEDYKGGRSLDDLKKAASELKPGCTVDQLENCDEKQKKDLETYTKMKPEDRSKQLDELKAKMAAAEKK